MTKKHLLTLGVLAAVAVGAFVFGGGLTLLQGKPIVGDPRANARHDPAADARPDWTLEDLVLKDDEAFDHRRAAAFKRAVEKVGRRCDSVTQALMQRPGLWVATCAPGYRFRFTYIQAGGQSGLTADGLPQAP